jgi:hypothetical protein
MRAIAVAIICCLLAIRVPGQVLKVYLNTNDCINCISSIAQLGRLNERIAVELFCDETKQRFIPALLEEYGVAADARTTIAFIPQNVLLSKAPISGQCEFFLGDSLLYGFELRQLNDYVPDLERASYGYERRERHPLKLEQPLGDRLTIFPAGEQVVLVDYLFRRSYLLVPVDGDSLRLTPLAPTDSLTRATMKRILGDLAPYDSLAAKYQNGPQFQHKVLAVNAQSGGFHFADLIGYVGYHSDGSLINTYRLAYFLWDEGSVNFAMYGKWFGIDPYLPVLDFGYHLGDSMLTVAVIRKEVSDEPICLLADFDRTGDSVAFRGFRDLRCPGSLQAFENGHSGIVGSMIRAGYYGTTGYPLVYDLVADLSHDLTSLLGDSSTDWFKNGVAVYHMSDILSLSDGTVLLLFQIDGVTQLAWLDLTNSRVIKRLIIDVTETDLNTLRLLDDGRVAGVSKANDAFVILQ